MSGPTNPTEIYFDKGGWGFDGTLWRKLNLLWGYNDQLFEKKVNLAALLGDNILYHTAVPAGEVWVVTGASAVDANTATRIQLGMSGGGTFSIIWDYGTPAPGVWVATPAENIVLKAGALMWTDFLVCAVGDDIYSSIWGYKMKVT